MSKHERHMRKNTFTKILITVATVFCAAFTIISVPSPVSAATEICQCTNTYSDGTTKVEEGSPALMFADSNGCYCGGTINIIKTALNIFMAGIAVLGTIGIIWSGFMYMSARDNEAQTAQAKNRMIQIFIGIAAFGLFDVAANLLLPGGMASATPTVVSSTSKKVARTDMEIERPASSAPTSTPSSSSTSSSSPSSSSTSSSSPSSSSQSSSSTPPGGNNCSDYGVGSGGSFQTQYSDETQWKGGNCPNCQIRKSGCPMVAALNAIIKVTGCKLTKKMFAQHMKEYTNGFTNRKGLFLNDSDWSNTGGPIVEHYLSTYKVHYKTISKGQVKSALQAGHAVVARGKGTDGSNHVFSDGGHYVAFTSISGNTVKVQNPARSAYGSVSYETAVKYATNFWEVWK